MDLEQYNFAYICIVGFLPVVPEKKLSIHPKI